MSPEERSDVAQMLEDSRQVFNQAAGGMTEAQAAISPAAGRWSVLQCVEHVTSVEERFFGMLQRAGKLELPAIDPQKESDLMTRVSSRATRAEAPEPVRPSGRFASLADAVAGFNAARAHTIAYVGERARDLHTLACQHPRFGDLNGRELCVIMAGHVKRHAEQIREVRAAL